MCGIFGKLAFRDAPTLSLTQLQEMGTRIRHRGPDDDGVLTDGPLAMGMRRLSIIDLAGGNQPITNRTNDYTVIFNGEIYNFRELRKDLENRGYPFRTNTDTEVIVHLYEEKGIDLLHDLRGMFAFALWDRRQRKLILARDRVGKKPLYYALGPRGITFGSEIKAVLADPSVHRELDPAAVDQYFTMQFIPHPRTIFKSIQKLPPAHYLVATPDGAEVPKRYWRLSFKKKRHLTLDDAKSAVLTHLRDATRRRLVSDVPLGLLLSGGLDSSAVAAMMAETAGGIIKTFSIGFENIAGGDDELGYAEKAAQRFGTDHHPIRLKADIAGLLPKLAAHYDEPFADSSVLPSWLVSQEARKSVTVVLNGDGGDEAFAGYPRYAGSSCLGRMFHHLPESFQRSIRRNLIQKITQPGGGHPGRLNHKLRKTLVPAHRCIFQPEAFSAADKMALYNPDFVSELDSGHWDDLLDLMEQSIADADDPAESLIGVDNNLYLPGDLLVKMDMASMAHSLEARSPFLDQDLLEFSAAMPMNLKIRNGTQKWILREAMRPFLPPEILEREKKGFGLPLRRWIRNDLKPMIGDILLGHPSGLERFLNPPELKRWMESILRRPKGDEKRLWSLLMFELWHREVMAKV